MKNNNMVTVLLRDYQVDYLEALCMRLRVNPDVLIGELLQWAALFAFSDSARRMIRGRTDDYWSTLVEEQFKG